MRKCFEVFLRVLLFLCGKHREIRMECASEWRENMKQPYVVDDDCLIVRLSEELDHHLTEKIRDTIDEIIVSKRIRYIIIDFKEQSFMDSSGIGFIMGRYKKIAVYQGKIFVVNLGRNLERIFRISGLYTITTPKDSVEKALCDIRGGNGK